MRIGKTTVEMSNMPIPASVCRGRTYRFPFDQLEIGKCFIVIGLTRNVLSSYKAYAEKHLGRKFTTKKIDKGIAVWRVQ